MTAHAVAILKEHLLDKTLYGVDQSVKLERFHEFYCDLFQYLHHHWLQSNPTDVMDFPAVSKYSMDAARQELIAVGSLTF